MTPVDTSIEERQFSNEMIVAFELVRFDINKILAKAESEGWTIQQTETAMRLL